MFYDNKEVSYRIIGAFYVERGKRDVLNSGRSHFALSLRIKGDSLFITNDESYPVKDGSVVYIPAGISFRHKSEVNEKLIVVHLEGSSPIKGDVETFADRKELEPSFRALLEAWESGKPTSYNRCMSILYSIFEKLSEPEVSPGAHSVINKGVELLQESFRDPDISVAALARASSVSEVYFRRIFREKFGTSPLQALLNLRFEYAKRLLSSGYYSVAQTAELSGFKDVKYFRSAFKSHFGITPTEYGKKEKRP